MLPTTHTKPPTDTPIIPYSPYQYIDNLPAYNLNEGTDIMMELVREIIYSGKYYNMVVPFPGGPLHPVNGGGIPWNCTQGQTISGTINVPAFSYLVDVSCYSQQPGGFKVRIMDKGTKADLFDRLYGWDKHLGSNNNSVEPNLHVASNSKRPRGPHYMLSPLIVTPPGVLQIDMSNMDTTNVTNFIEIAMQFAVPTNAISQNVPIVTNIQG